MRVPPLALLRSLAALRPSLRPVIRRRPLAHRVRLERLEDRLALAVGAIDGAPLPAFDIGTPVLTDYWVDPVRGDDGRDGASRDAALRTVTEAWSRIPVDTTLTCGYRINLVAGVYSAESVPNYWEHRIGTHDAPEIGRAHV